MRFQVQMYECIKWQEASFNEIPSFLIVRGYAARPAELKLLAGGQRRSNCCDDDVTTEALSGRAVDRCRKCSEACDVHWSGARKKWPAAWHLLYTPRDAFDRKWMSASPELIAAKCGFLVYELDTSRWIGEDPGPLLALDTVSQHRAVERHWFPLHRLRVRALQAAEQASRAAKRARVAP